MTTLHVDYDDAEDLLAEYDATLSTGSAFFATERDHAPGTRIKLVLAFPQLRAPIRIDAVVADMREDDGVRGVFAELDAEARATLDAAIAALRAGDPAMTRKVLRVLVVEDNHHVAELLHGGLRGAASEELTFDLTTAIDGREALVQLQTSKFDLLIVDVYLPAVDGPEVIRRARGELGLVDVPILAVSAGGESARSVALEAGANAFLNKPVRLREVFETVRKLCAIEKG